MTTIANIQIGFEYMNDPPSTLIRMILNIVFGDQVTPHTNGIVEFTLQDLTSLQSQRLEDLLRPYWKGKIQRRREILLEQQTRNKRVQPDSVPEVSWEREMRWNEYRIISPLHLYQEDLQSFLSSHHMGLRIIDQVDFIVRTSTSTTVEELLFIEQTYPLQLQFLHQVVMD